MGAARSVQEGLRKMCATSGQSQPCGLQPGMGVKWHSQTPAHAVLRVKAHPGTVLL